MPIQKDHILTTWQRLANAFTPWPLRPVDGQFRILGGSLEEPAADRRNVPPTEHDLLVDTARLRNREFDTFFYNVNPDDLRNIKEFKGMQGSIVCVWPDKVQSVQYGDAYQMLVEVGNEIGAVAVAGVGSSALGAAALARDVAAATNVPVAAVVSGYGADDILYETLGGAFFLREDNQLEFWFEKTLHALPGATLLPYLVPWLETWDCIGCGPDVVTLKSVLRNRRLKNLQWVVGHSKGNLVISSALSELLMEGILKESDVEDVNIVLLSAVTALPPNVGKQYQIIGALDGFGAMNSRMILPYKIVPGASHHLNRNYMFHLDAVKELTELREQCGA